MCPGLQHDKSSGRAECKAGVSLPSPNRRELPLEVEVAEFIKNQEVLALADLRTADQHDVTLAGRDARQRNSRRIDAGCFFAHERAGSAADAVDDGDIAREQIR